MSPEFEQVTTAELRYGAHEARLADHEVRLRQVEQDANKAHDAIRALRAEVKGSIEKLQLRVYIWAAAGGASAIIGKDIYSWLRGLLP